MNIIELAKQARDAELLAGSGEPDYFIWDSDRFPSGWVVCDKDQYEHTKSVCEDDAKATYTADQLAAAVLQERERCAKVADNMDHDGVMIAKDIAAAIRGQK